MFKVKQQLKEQGFQVLREYVPQKLSLVNSLCDQFERKLTEIEASAEKEEESSLAPVKVADAKRKSRKRKRKEALQTDEPSVKNRAVFISELQRAVKKEINDFAESMHKLSQLCQVFSDEGAKQRVQNAQRVTEEAAVGALAFLKYIPQYYQRRSQLRLAYSTEEECINDESANVHLDDDSQRTLEEYDSKHISLLKKTLRDIQQNYLTIHRLVSQAVEPATGATSTLGSIFKIQAEP